MGVAAAQGEVKQIVGSTLKDLEEDRWVAEQVGIEVLNVRVAMVSCTLQ